MFVAIRKEQNGSLYLDKDIYSRKHEIKDNNGNIQLVPIFTDEKLAMPPYNYTKVEIDDIYADCQSSDFNDNLTFSVDKYNARKTLNNNLIRQREIQARLNELSQDFVQVVVGAELDDIEERKQEFKELHNELRGLLGKEPREYN